MIFFNRPNVRTVRSPVNSLPYLLSSPKHIRDETQTVKKPVEVGLTQPVFTSSPAALPSAATYRMADRRAREPLQVLLRRLSVSLSGLVTCARILLSTLAVFVDDSASTHMYPYACSVLSVMHHGKDGSIITSLGLGNTNTGTYILYYSIYMCSVLMPATTTGHNVVQRLGCAGHSNTVFIRCRRIFGRRISSVNRVLFSAAAWAEQAGTEPTFLT